MHMIGEEEWHYRIEEAHLETADHGKYNDYYHSKHYWSDAVIRKG